MGERGETIMKGAGSEGAGLLKFYSFRNVFIVC